MRTRFIELIDMLFDQLVAKTDSLKISSQATDKISEARRLITKRLEKFSPIYMANIQPEASLQEGRNGVSNAIIGRTNSVESLHILTEQEHS